MTEKWGGKPNGSKWWSEEDIKLLKELRDAGVCGDRLSEIVGRSKIAVWSKSRAIGLAPGHFRTWTKEQEDDLRKYHAEGLSFSAIGRLVGHNKNSCIGKAHRMNLTPRDQQKSRALGAIIVNQTRKRRSGLVYKRREKQSKPLANIRKSPIFVNGNAPGLVPLEHEPIHLVQIKNGQCKFIEGDDRMCCGRKALEGFSWCPHHYARAHILDKRSASMAGLHQQSVEDRARQEHSKQEIQALDRGSNASFGLAESEVSNW